MDPEIEEILCQLKQDRWDATELFVHEEIIDVETFVALDNTDFCRLELTTGQRKKILKYQSQLLKKFNCVPVKENSQQEEDFVEEASEDTAECEIVGDSIPLENEFDIDLVFRQSAEGLRIMELLRQENEVDGKLIKAITTVLCDYLVRRFGYHPSMHYKDVIAKSLVRKYSTLKSRSAAIPE
nr:uncharacterized protein LOC109418169 [Aedes albopictus]